MTRLWLAGVTTCALTISLPVSAGGFRLPDLSTTGMSMGNAVVANHEDFGAVPYNPAAMAFHEGTKLFIGTALLDHDITVSRSGQSTVHSDPKTPINIPFLHFSHRFNEDWAYGININAPFGLETRWPAGTFSGADPTHTRIKMVNLNPNVAYRISDESAVSFGLAHYLIQEAIQNTGTATLNGEGANTGVQAGYLYAAKDWSVGATYRSAIKVKLEGVLNGALPIEMDLDLPWLAQVGVRYKFTDALAVEADIEREGWSELKETRIKNLAGATVALNTNQWQDSNVFRLGASYDWDDHTTFHAGFLKDQTPVPDAHFSARLPSSNYKGYSIGVSHKVGDADLHIGYQYFDFDTRQVNSSVPFGTYGADANGTDDYNGDYNLDIQVLSIGLTYQFD